MKIIDLSLDVCKKYVKMIWVLSFGVDALCEGTQRDRRKEEQEEV